MRAWVSTQLGSLDETPALRWYAVILSLLHTLTGGAWFAYKHIAELTTQPRAVCWPLFPGCAAWREHLSPDLVRQLVYGYMALGVVAAILFATRRRRAALAVFVTTSAYGSALYALDYGLRFNQTYMFGWVVLVFLLAPRKLALLQVLVASFYFWAGTLKLNVEWTSGAALYAKPWLVPQALVPASCVYVLVLELALVWGLFSSRPRLRWAVYAQLCLFHVTSFGVVGWFYPILMAGLGAIFPLAWRAGEAVTLPRLRADRALVRVVALTALVFAAFQLIPHLFPGDTAVTGEGRLFALHMFDAKIECEGGGLLVAPDGSVRPQQLIDQRADIRSRCDPLQILATARWLCDSMARRGDPSRLDVSVQAKRATAVAMQPLIEVSDFCHADLTYSTWQHNAWIGR